MDSIKITIHDKGDKFKDNPYNENNKLISKKNIEEVFSKIGFELDIQDLSLYQNAFVHKSYCMNNDYKEFTQPPNCVPLFTKSYERMEFLGDSQLGAVVASYLFERFPDENEGFMTKMKTKLVNGVRLADFSKFLGLGEWAIISDHFEKNCQGRTTKNLLEDIFEALLGAIYLDNSDINDDYSNYENGFKLVYKFLVVLIETTIDFTDLILNENNHKELILKYLHHNYGYHPKYEQIDCIIVDEHTNKYIVNIVDKEGNEICKGEGSSKKGAEQNASKNALLKFGVI
jgi:ribonuclease-3